MKLGLALLVAIMGLIVLSMAQQVGYDPEGQLDPKTYSCAQYIELVDLADGRSDVRMVWAHGYNSALGGVDESSPPITSKMIVEWAERLEKICRDNPDKLFFTAIKEIK